jgi:hypothetical protein
MAAKRDKDKTHGIIAALVRAISIRIAQCQMIGMAGTSPAMTKRACHESCPVAAKLPTSSFGPDP